jgi:hypothetical protein
LVGGYVGRGVVQHGWLVIYRKYGVHSYWKNRISRSLPFAEIINLMRGFWETASG